MFVFGLFLISFCVNAQEYKLTIGGRISTPSSVCGDDNYARIFVVYKESPNTRVEVLDRVMSGDSYTVDEEIIFSHDNPIIEVFTESRRKSNNSNPLEGDCNFEPPESKTIPIPDITGSNIDRCNFVIDNDPFSRYSSSTLRIAILPVHELNFNNGASRTSTELVCPEVGVEITTKLDESDVDFHNEVYEWQFYDSINLDTIEHPALTALRKALDDANQALFICMFTGGGECEAEDTDIDDARDAIDEYLDNSVSDPENYPLTLDIPAWRSIANTCLLYTSPSPRD